MNLNNENIFLQNNLYGLNKYLIDLLKLFDCGKLPKVLMFSGKKGQGKFTLTHHLMSYIFDKKNYDTNSFTINKANKIFYDIKKNLNPNITYLACSEKNIKIEDIRKLRENLQMSSINNSFRFIIIDDIEYLNENCINALLKSIEEPSSINNFILINNQTSPILDTLKSRSVEILFFLNKTEKKEITQRLISDFKIEANTNLSDTLLTPGNYLKYSKFLSNDEININDKLIINIEKLYKLNKSKKNIDYLNFAVYLINQYYFNISKNDPDNHLYNDKRINIIKKINETNKLNLNHKNLFIELENHI